MVHPRGGARQELPGGLGEDGAPTFRSPQEAASAAAAQGIPGRGLRPAQREPAVSGLQTSHRWGCCILMGFFNLKEPGRSPADISCSCVGERSMMYSVRDEGWAGGPKGVGPGVQGGLVSGRGAFLSSSLPPPPFCPRLPEAGRLLTSSLPRAAPAPRWGCQECFWRLPESWIRVKCSQTLLPTRAQKQPLVTTQEVVRPFTSQPLQQPVLDAHYVGTEERR